MADKIFQELQKGIERSLEKKRLVQDILLLGLIVSVAVAGVYYGEYKQFHKDKAFYEEYIFEQCDCVIPLETGKDHVRYSAKYNFSSFFQT